MSGSGGQHADLIARHKAQIEEHNEHIEKLKADIAKIEAHIADLQKRINSNDTLENAQLVAKHEAVTRISRYDNEIVGHKAALKIAENELAKAKKDVSIHEINLEKLKSANETYHKHIKESQSNLFKLEHTKHDLSEDVEHFKRRNEYLQIGMSTSTLLRNAESALQSGRTLLPHVNLIHHDHDHDPARSMRVDSAAGVFRSGAGGSPAGRAWAADTDFRSAPRVNWPSNQAASEAAGPGRSGSGFAAGPAAGGGEGVFVGGPAASARAGAGLVRGGGVYESRELEAEQRRQEGVRRWGGGGGGPGARVVEAKAADGAGGHTGDHFLRKGDSFNRSDDSLEIQLSDTFEKTTRAQGGQVGRAGHAGTTYTRWQDIKSAKHTFSKDEWREFVSEQENENRLEIVKNQDFVHTMNIPTAFLVQFYTDHNHYIWLYHNLDESWVTLKPA